MASQTSITTSSYPPIIINIHLETINENPIVYYLRNQQVIIRDINEYNIIFPDAEIKKLFPNNYRIFLERKNLFAQDKQINLIWAEIQSYKNNKMLLALKIKILSQKYYFDFDEKKFYLAKNEIEIFLSILQRSKKTHRKTFLAKMKTFSYPNIPTKTIKKMLDSIILNSKHLNVNINGLSNDEIKMKMQELLKKTLASRISTEDQKIQFSQKSSPHGISYSIENNILFGSQSDLNDVNNIGIPMKIITSSFLLTKFNEFIESEKGNIENMLLPFNCLITFLIIDISNVLSRCLNESSVRQFLIEIYHFIFEIKMNKYDLNNVSKKAEDLLLSLRLVKEELIRKNRSKKNKKKFDLSIFINIDKFLNFLELIFKIEYKQFHEQYREQIFVKPIKDFVTSEISIQKTLKISKNIILKQAESIKIIVDKFFLEKKYSNELHEQKVKFKKNPGFLGIEKLLSSLFNTLEFINENRNKLKISRLLKKEHFSAHVSEFFHLFIELLHNEKFKVFNKNTYIICKNAFKKLLDKEKYMRSFKKDLKKPLLEILSKSDSEIINEIKKLNLLLKKFVFSYSTVITINEKEFMHIFDCIEQKKAFDGYEKLCSKLNDLKIDLKSQIIKISKQIEILQEMFFDFMIAQDQKIAKKLSSILEIYNEIISERVITIFEFINNFNLSNQAKHKITNDSKIIITSHEVLPISINLFNIDINVLCSFKEIHQMLFHNKSIEEENLSDNKEKNITLLFKTPAPPKSPRSEDLIKQKSEKSERESLLQDLKEIFNIKKTRSISKKLKLWAKVNGINIFQKSFSHGSGSGHIDLLLCKEGRRIPITIPNHRTLSIGVKESIKQAFEDILIF